MRERDRNILKAIIREHIATGAPVGSSHLVEKYKLDVSSATVRNVMAELEEEGYICQPHTSAGRVPTEKAYLMVVDELKDKKSIKKMRESEVKTIEEVFNIDGELRFKEMAKTLARITDSAVFWAFHKHNLYYTGLSNLFRQPEFANSSLVYDFSEVVDRMDEIINDIYDNVGFEPEVLLGTDNPFGNFCSTILVKYREGENTGLFGILSPMRTDYEGNMGIIKYIIKMLNDKC
jgi:heat-inducible transcriptional repressor